MPTLLNFNGYKFFFYANDHFPPHVHILKGDGWAKIELKTEVVIYSSFKASELKECCTLVSEHKSEFLEKWNEWFVG